eukprot:g30606.t1
MVNGRALRSVVEHRDLGVQVHGSLKAESQVDRAVKKAFDTLAFISQGIKYRSWEVILQFYRMLNILQLVRDNFDPGTREATYHPGISFAAAEMPIYLLTVESPVTIALPFFFLHLCTRATL